ncbi:Tubulin folding cofactor D C terminal [Popillia japonica]|uniref:Tubulin-specific chaperone D n=1 Tax=Popillia japonica TaxID=7064 RepID=A0AAW1JZ23_POPJA
MSSANPPKEEIQKDEDVFGLGCALEMFTEHTEVLEMIANLKNTITSSRSIIERAYERFLDILKQYQEQPHLLDSHIEDILSSMITIIRSQESDMKLKHEVFKYMYVVIKVRGYKVIVRQLPHEVADFEPVLQLLESQDAEDSDTWTTRYVLLLWLSIIVMIPFHMSRLDGFDSTESNKNKTVMWRVLDVCKIYAIVSDKCRDAAAYLVSKFLTRNDVKEQHLKPFFDWASELSSNSEASVFIKYGTLASVAMILKHGKREDLLPHARNLLEWIVGAEFKNNPGSNVQKLVYKIIQRIGLTFLPPRNVSWRYQRGNRSLAANLSAGDSTGGNIPNQQVKTTTQEADTAEDIDVPDEIEEVLDQLIQGLGSGDSVVRWSAAKGIGRVTSRLNKELADDVVGSILELFNPRESDSSWHGGCLALAELGRRGLLLPQRLPEVVPVIMKALTYDEPRGYASVGSHIRDSACYVCWSFARAYETEILKPYVNDIASGLLVMACFDREINCRRAASAAFQENVGRQGSFPHGIDILTTADFFAVSVRNNSYLTISVFIAQFEEYVYPLINHLLERKVDHWDVAIRELTAKALHNLTPKAPEYVIDVVLPELFNKSSSIDLNCRHGSVLAIGEVLYALSNVAKTKGVKIDDYIGTTLIENTRKLIPLFKEKLYYRGIGGELMKQASSDFIQKCSLAQLPFHKDDITDQWLQLLNECLSYDVPTIRNCAITALPALFSEFYQGNTSEDLARQETIVNDYVNQLSSTNFQVTRMGYALAIGCLPSFMIRPHLSMIIKALIESTVITTVTTKWAESRRDSIKALTSICTTLENELKSVFSHGQIIQIYHCLLIGLTEYTQDNRGDIGAWVREASMIGLQTLTLLLATHNPDALSEDIVLKVSVGVVQQAVEKIDRTRALAGKVFYNLLYNNPEVPNIPHHAKLKEIFTEDCEMLNWNSAATTFPKFVQLIDFNEYQYNLLLGLVCSIGGLTETLVKNSSHFFFDKLKEVENSKGSTEIIRLSDIICKIFLDYQKVDRITVPMFRFLDKLFSSGCISCIINQPDHDFPKKIFKLIQIEINGCKDIYKLIDGIAVLCQYLQVKGEICANVLVQLAILLCHRQSYVRRSTSTRLYESLLVYGDTSIIPIDNLDDVMNLLSSTDWEEPVEQIKPLRNELCNLMGIRVPVAKKK